MYLTNLEMITLSINVPSIPKILLTEDYRSLSWNPSRHPHALIVGGTGSGKTYFTKLLLGKIAKYDLDSELILCDYKGDTSLNFKQAYRYDRVADGLSHFLELFEARMHSGRDNYQNLYLCFDELGAYLTSLERKDADSQKKAIAKVLMLGRSFNCHLITALQRADASFFANGARDNFPFRLGLGKLSPESQRMLFPGEDQALFSAFPGGQGRGFLIRDGSPLQPILVPEVSNESLLDATIATFLDRLPVTEGGAN